MRSRLLKKLTLERFLVTLHDGQAFLGLLHDSDDRVLILRDVQAVGAGNNGVNLPVDGEIVLFIDNVAHAQRL